MEKREEISEGFTIHFYIGDEVVQTDRHIVSLSRAIEISGENWETVKTQGCTTIGILRECDGVLVKIYE